LDDTQLFYYLKRLYVEERSNLSDPSLSLANLEININSHDHEAIAKLQNKVFAMYDYDKNLRGYEPSVIKKHFDTIKKNLTTNRFGLLWNRSSEFEKELPM
jgi:hypothetical protein